MTDRIRRAVVVLALVVAASGASAAPARAARSPLRSGERGLPRHPLNYIRNETVGIDVGFWFMEDARYTAELIRRFQAGVPVRVLMDLRANETNAFNPQRLAELRAAGIPMRHRTASSGIMHYKLMLFAGQSIVEFSGANFSADAWVFTGPVPYVNYVDESVYFTDNAAFVQSFMTKYDDLWTNTTAYADYANVPQPLRAPLSDRTRRTRSSISRRSSRTPTARSNRYNQETQKIDVIMYRITDRRHTDAIIAAKARGIPVRLISDPQQYRGRVAAVGVVEHRPPVHGGRPGQNARAPGPEPPEARAALQPDDVDLRLVELDEPVRQRRRKSTTASAPMRTCSSGSRTCSSGSGTTPRASSRTPTSSRCRPTRR